LSFEASHNGYKKQGLGVVHKRMWRLNEGDIEIDDSFLTDNAGSFSSFYHFHPDVCLTDNVKGSIDCNLNGQQLTFTTSHGDVSIIESKYASGFSVTRPSQSIVVSGEYQGSIKLKCILKVIK
jgi:uncharacterized heparinase superfamily protein